MIKAGTRQRARRIKSDILIYRFPYLVRPNVTFSARRLAYAYIRHSPPIIDARIRYPQHLARNKYLKAIRDGFISVMPIIIVSSIFLLVSAVPNVWGFCWPAEIDDVLMKAYNYSMGIVGICAAATTAKHFCDAESRPAKNNQSDFISVMIASLISFCSPATPSASRITASPSRPRQRLHGSRAC